jgi:hypothetical protein
MTFFLKNLDLSKIKSYKKQSKKVEQSQPVQFPVKLFHMLEAVEREGNEHIVSWHSDGNSFQVHNARQFVDVVLPSNFKQSKYKSFQPQLNFYGFQRITSGPLEGSYEHGSFIKGDEALCKQIRRHQAQQPTKSIIAISDYIQSSDYDESPEIDTMETTETTETPISIEDISSSSEIILTTTAASSSPAKQARPNRRRGS